MKNINSRLRVGDVEPDLIDSLALPLNRDADLREGELNELANGVHLARGEDKVVWGLLLQHAPHPFDVVAGMSPIAPNIIASKYSPVLVSKF